MTCDHSVTYKNLSLKNMIHITRLKYIKRAIIKMMSQYTFKSYIDVGCSNGYITKIISNTINSKKTIGLDHNKVNLENGKQMYPDIIFNYFDLNIKNEFYEKCDLVTCFEVLEHTGNILQALNNLLSVCSKNGHIFISVPIEIGFTGFIKYWIKTRLYNYTLVELAINDNRHRKEYERDLIFNNDISKYRKGINKNGFGTHFGFDYRVIDKYLINNRINYSAKNKFYTRYYIIKR